MLILIIEQNRENAINASDDQEISFDDLIGVTEKVTVMYPNNGNWGTFTDRKPLEKATAEVAEEEAPAAESAE